MYYLVKLTEELEVQPMFLGPRLKEVIEERLRSKLEGSCSPDKGYILAVIRVTAVRRGLIREGVGNAVFEVSYDCMTFMPFRGEVVDATVTSVNKMGFFAETGPLQVFVSNHCIPEDFEFESAHEPSYVTATGDLKIQVKSEVRLRIVGTKINGPSISAVGTIKDDYLGVIA